MDQKVREIERVSTMGVALLPVAFGDQFEYSMYNKQGSSFSLPTEVSSLGSTALCCCILGVGRDRTERPFLRTKLFSDHKEIVYINLPFIVIFLLVNKFCCNMPWIYLT